MCVCVCVCVRVCVQVARNEAALQSEVEHYRRVVRELTAQLEEVRRQNVALPPAGTDVHELMRLREEVYTSVCVFMETTDTYYALRGALRSSGIMERDRECWGRLGSFGPQRRC